MTAIELFRILFKLSDLQISDHEAVAIAYEEYVRLVEENRFLKPLIINNAPVTEIPKPGEPGPLGWKIT